MVLSHKTQPNIVFFTGFTVEEIGQMRQDHQRQREQESLCNVDAEIEALIDEPPRESPSNFDVTVFAESDEESSESSNEESKDAPPKPLQWSNTLSGINVQEFSVRHGPSRNLGGNAMAKDFLNFFINDKFRDEIVQHSIAYASLLAEVSHGQGSKLSF